MTFSVRASRSAAPVIKQLRGDARRAFERAVRELEHQGCRAAGYRLRGAGVEHARVCERRFYGDWRMHLVFRSEEEIVISFVGRHAPETNIHEVAAEVMPEIATTGRRERVQCCEDPEDPPIAEDLVELLDAMRPDEVKQVLERVRRST